VFGVPVYVWVGQRVFVFMVEGKKVIGALVLRFG
jgi:hypothetical protein